MTCPKMLEKNYMKERVNRMPPYIFERMDGEINNAL